MCECGPILFFPIAGRCRMFEFSNNILQSTQQVLRQFATLSSLFHYLPALILHLFAIIDAGLYGIVNGLGLQPHLVALVRDHVAFSLDQTFSLGFVQSADFYLLLDVFCFFEELGVDLDREALCLGLLYLGIVSALCLSDFLGELLVLDVELLQHLIVSFLLLFQSNQIAFDVAGLLCWIALFLLVDFAQFVTLVVYFLFQFNDGLAVFCKCCFGLSNPLIQGEMMLFLFQLPFFALQSLQLLECGLQGSLIAIPLFLQHLNHIFRRHYLFFLLALQLHDVAVNQIVQLIIEFLYQISDLVVLPGQTVHVALLQS